MAMCRVDNAQLVHHGFTIPTSLKDEPRCPTTAVLVSPVPATSSLLTCVTVVAIYWYVKLICSAQQSEQPDNAIPFISTPGSFFRSICIAYGPCRRATQTLHCAGRSSNSPLPNACPRVNR